MSSAITTHTGPLSAQERADIAWGTPSLPHPEVARHRRLIAALRRSDTKATPECRVLVDRTYWRRYLDCLQRGICHRCGGTGEIYEVGALGEYEGTIPCWVCHPYLPTVGQVVDDTPF